MDWSKQALWVIGGQIIIILLLGFLFRLAQDVYHPEVPVTATHVHKHFYVDKGMNPFYFAEIKWAADRWTEATHRLADLEVDYINDKNRDKILDDQDAIVVTMVTEDHPDIINMDKEIGKPTVAYCDIAAKTPILAYVSGRITDPDFEKVTLHEMGHALKLEHVDDPHRIMFPTTTLMSDFLGREDIAQFCATYHCDPNSLQYEEEALHP